MGACARRIAANIAKHAGAASSEQSGLATVTQKPCTKFGCTHIVFDVKSARGERNRARDLAKKLGVDIKQVFLTSGESDLLLILETPNTDNIPKFAMAIGSLGNVRTRTVRAWPEAEMTKFISELP
jgi:uncharacterized protein with GYD domain